MSSFLIIGDIHLGSGANISKSNIGSSINSRVIDQFNILNFCLQKAIELNIFHIVITGDIYDVPSPQAYLISLFIDWLKECSAHNINVSIIDGNHDITRYGNFYTSSLDVISSADIKNVYIYKNIDTIIYDDIGITFVPFRDRKALNATTNVEALEILNNHIIYENSTIPRTYKKILIGHLAIEGSIPVSSEISDIANELFCPLSMFSNYDFTIMGHIHKYQVLSRKPYISHIGSMDVFNFGETDQKKYMILIDGSKDDISLIELPTRRLLKISIDVPKGTENTTQFILDEINNIKSITDAIVKIDISLLSPELVSPDRKRIENHIYDLGAFHIASFSEHKKSQLVKRAQEIVMSNIIDEISAIKSYAANYIDKDKRDKFIELSLSILDDFRNL